MKRTNLVVVAYVGVGSLSVHGWEKEREFLVIAERPLAAKGRKKEKKEKNGRGRA